MPFDRSESEIQTDCILEHKEITVTHPIVHFPLKRRGGIPTCSVFRFETKGFSQSFETLLDESEIERFKQIGEH